MKCQGQKKRKRIWRILLTEALQDLYSVTFSKAPTLRSWGASNKCWFILSHGTQEAAKHLSHFCRTELTWRAGVTAASDLLDAAGRTHRPSRAAGWAAPHPCAWCPAPKVSQLHAAPATFPAQDAHSAHALNVVRIYTWMPRYLISQRRGKQFRRQILRVRWLGFAPCALGAVRAGAHSTFLPAVESGSFTSTAQVKAASCAGYWNGGYDLHAYSYFHVQCGQLSEVDEGIKPNNGTFDIVLSVFPTGVRRWWLILNHRVLVVCVLVQADWCWFDAFLVTTLNLSHSIGYMLKSTLPVVNMYMQLCNSLLIHSRCPCSVDPDWRVWSRHVTEVTHSSHHTFQVFRSTVC